MEEMAFALLVGLILEMRFAIYKNGNRVTRVEKKLSAHIRTELVS